MIHSFALRVAVEVGVIVVAALAITICCLRRWAADTKEADRG